MMPSVGMRRTTRVFGARVLRSGRRLWSAPVERKHVRRSESVSNSGQWIELLDNSGGNCRSDEDSTACLRNGCRLIEDINMDSDKKSEECKSSKISSLIGNKMWGAVYYRKRRRTDSASTNFDGGSRKKRATWRNEGIVSLPSPEAETCNYLGSGRLRVLAIVTEPGSSNGSYWVACLLNMVLRYMAKAKVRFQQLSAFMLSNPLNQIFSIHNIHFSQDSSLIGRPGICQLFGAKCFIPQFTLYFSGIPSCFFSLHLSMQLRSVCHLHFLTYPNDEDENNFEVSDDSNSEDLDVKACIPPSNSDSAAIETLTVRSGRSRKKKVTASSSPSRRSCRVLHPRNGVNSRSNIRKRTFMPRRVKNTPALGVGVNRANLFRSRQNCKSLASITLNSECKFSVQRKSASTSSMEPTRVMDSTSCSVNVLVIEQDRCYRIEKAIVKLEEISASSKHWFLAVRKDNVLKYSLEAHNVMRPCSNNRVTHDIIWTEDNNRCKLEFPDRQDWFIFKELYRECSQRNLMAPVVSAISVPGVKYLTGYIDSGEDVPFVRPQYYITLKDDELSRTLAKKTAIYDMDSDDEQWLDGFNDVSSGTGEMNKDLLQDSFELIIDALEKTSFCNPDDHFGKNTPPNLCLDLGEKEVVESVCNYWMSKRKKKHSPLIKVYQCYQPRKPEVLLPNAILRKKRSFKRKPSQSGRGKQRFFMKAFVAGQGDCLVQQQEADNALLKEVKESSTKVGGGKSEEEEERLAILKRKKAQVLMENADLAIYKAMISLRIAEAAARVVELTDVVIGSSFLEE
ncbi:uncharacterized protein LOC124928181 [Impatiens glandulifera]|uniref:uncharacterized protein LOC124928181 n=1 Tax=Impatiens glandulifera TaxID=253017 RepID=UPI001FB17EE6|nr:uncharacterized protein LOC124928181 [Impatiens glandulifera]XP_047324666.1 uncharacterized protein LOC124928181 [Impatiens glandulifera]